MLDFQAGFGALQVSLLCSKVFIQFFGCWIWLAETKVAQQSGQAKFSLDSILPQMLLLKLACLTHFSLLVF